MIFASRIIQFITSVVLAFPNAAFAATTTIDNVTIRLAQRATPEHVPVRVTSEFRGSTGSIAVTFHSLERRGGFGSHNITFDIFSYDQNRVIAGGAWVQFGHGQNFSTTINPRQFDMNEGKYQLRFKSGNRHTQLDFELLGRAPRAIRIDTRDALGADFVARNSQWSGFESWSLPSRSPNIAASALGGQVVDTRQGPDAGWSRRNLNDGLPGVYLSPSPVECHHCGWSDGSASGQATANLVFHQGREAEIGALIFDSRVVDWTEQQGHLAFLPKYLTITTFDGSGNKTFSVEAMLPREEGRFLVPIPEGVRGARATVRITETHGGGQPVLAEIEVRERVRNGQSILADAEVDLLRVGLGATLANFTGQSEDNYAMNLIDDDNSRIWASADRAFPQDFTFAMPDNRRAFIGSVVVDLPMGRRAPATGPSQIAIAVGEQSVIAGLTEVARFAVPKKAGRHSFPINRDARFVQVRILDNHGADVTTLSRISAIEGKRDGYRSIVLRHERDVADTVADAGPVIGEITEAEPNNTPEEANPLIVSELMRGRIEPLGEKDVFRLPADADAADTITLQYAGIPNIRHSVEMTTCDGEIFSSFDPGKVPSSKTNVTFLIQGDECFAELSEPEASMVLVWDTSGSMHGRENDLKRALSTYLDQVPKGQNVGLIRFSEDVEWYGRFSKNTAGLKRWAGSRVTAKGSTRIYDAIEVALDKLRNRPGNRGIIVMSDGIDTASNLWLGELWDRLADDKVRIYTIGLGEDLNDFAAPYGATGRGLMEQLALATDGDAFFTTEGAGLRRFYSQIATELSAPATYELTPLLESGEGELRLIATGDKVPGAAMPAVHVLFDVSGSMAEALPDGKRKITEAKAAVNAIIKELPDRTPFSFTAYGHRVAEKPDKALACEDIETLHSFAPINKSTVARSIDRLKTRGGTTPLTRGVAHIADTSGEKSGGIIIVITDGIEECDATPLKTIEELRQAGLEKLQLDVVGFNLKDDASRDLMEKIAELGGGSYYDASEGEALAQALRLAAAARFAVKDSAGRIVGRGTIGGAPVPLPPGWFTVEIQAADRTFAERQVRIEDGARTTMRVLKVGSRFSVATDTPHPKAELAAALRRCGEPALSRDQADVTRRVQSKLNKLGFDVGAADGQAGRRTRAGILSFQIRYGIAADPAVTQRLEQHLDCVAAWGEPYGGEPT